MFIFHEALEYTARVAKQDIRNVQSGVAEQGGRLLNK
jgi:hypothetical protein